MKPDFTPFNYVWRILAKQGTCDCIGGAEYKRVRLQWLAMGRPRPIHEFIKWQANLPAPGTEKAWQLYGN